MGALVLVKECSVFDGASCYLISRHLRWRSGYTFNSASTVGKNLTCEVHKTSEWAQ